MPSHRGRRRTFSTFDPAGAFRAGTRSLLAGCTTASEERRADCPGAHPRIGTALGISSDRPHRRAGARGPLILARRITRRRFMPLQLGIWSLNSNGSLGQLTITAADTSGNVSGTLSIGGDLFGPISGLWDENSARLTFSVGDFAYTGFLCPPSLRLLWRIFSPTP
jgi:hypothetical protein